MAQHFHQCAAMGQLGVDGLDHTHRKVALVFDLREQGPVIDPAGLYRRRGNGRVGITILVDRLQADQKALGAAQADDLLAPVRRMRTDLDHAIRYRVQASARLALHKQDFVIIEFHMLDRIIQHAVNFGRRKRPILGPNYLERAITITAWHGWSGRCELSDLRILFLVFFAPPVDSDLPSNISVFT